MRWGTATLLAVLAAIGISSQAGRKPQDNGSPREGQRRAARTITAKPGGQNPCADLIALFQDFLVSGPVPTCGADGVPSAATPPSAQTFQPSFVIATLPDPLHTHFSLLFDRFVEAIQQAAQDELYEYDSSWLPWETEEPSLGQLSELDAIEVRKNKREDQPGVLLFRGKTDHPYQNPLVVFVVGEEPTRGIHRKQFQNAVAWIKALRGETGHGAPVAVLGPTFSGSFQSLTEMLKFDGLSKDLYRGPKLAIFSGSTTSKEDALTFAKNPGIDFHSFLQDDETGLNRFCQYLSTNHFDPERLAILSEDETAYGYSTTKTDDKEPYCRGATWLYYPRDISTLRAAYQHESMFSSGQSQASEEAAQRWNLPTDLADPAGREHDTVRTYAGNQTPLSQEAQLLGIVEALRSHRAQYIVLRSSNTLDPLFLANFLRRNYPEGRIVVVNSDLLFQRGQDALSLTGVITLSTYPLFPLLRHWEGGSHDDGHSHRVFPENSTEATYIALRLLLQLPQSTDKGDVQDRCVVLSDKEVFLPSLTCGPNVKVPLPDYAPPYWMQKDHCQANQPSESCKPASWLSVITKSGSWPLAALNEDTLGKKCDRAALAGPDQTVEESGKTGKTTRTASAGSHVDDHAEHLPLPFGMRLFWLALLVLSLFHAWCCWGASFTAKPAFRAHFATYGHRHRFLVLFGSLLISLMALIAGWGCGIFSGMPNPPLEIVKVRVIVWAIWLLSAFSIFVNIVVARELNEDAANRVRASHGDAAIRWRGFAFLVAFCLLLAMFYYTWAYQLECALLGANRVLVYWRSMNLTSGVSPILPFLWLTAGAYIWFWYALHGLALFGEDRPCLPPRETLIITFPSTDDCKAKDQELDLLPMFSQQGAAEPAEAAAIPLAWHSSLLSFVLFFVFWAIVWGMVGGEVPIRSLGARTYAIILCFWLDFCCALIVAASWQLWNTWSRLRELLVFLDRTALRRTLGALRGFSWGSVWKMGGNVLDVRYKLLSRQLECLNHLRASLDELKETLSKAGGNQEERESAKTWSDTIDHTRNVGIEFAKWYSANYSNPRAAGLKRFEELQQGIAGTAGYLLTHVLFPAWRKEEHSLILVDPDKTEADRKPYPAQSEDEHVRNAEEFVCLNYLGFVQNLLGRIRTQALAATSLFVAMTLAMASYPFDPRPALTGVMLALFVLFGGTVVFVYADMHRDATLSHVTNTTPGELGSEFWYKLIGYGAAPLLGLLTTVFPQWSSFLVSWLQPGIASIK